MEKLIDLKDVTVKYGDNVVLDNRYQTAAPYNQKRRSVLSIRYSRNGRLYAGHPLAERRTNDCSIVTNCLWSSHLLRGLSPQSDLSPTFISATALRTRYLAKERAMRASFILLIQFANK